MPVHFNISTDLNVVVARWQGEVDVCEYRASFSAYLEDKDYCVNRRELCDLSGITSVDADFKRIWSILTMVNSPARGGPVYSHCAIYAPDDVTFGLARMYQSVADSANGVIVSVFRQEAEALAQLELPYDTVDRLIDAGKFRTIAQTSGESGQESYLTA